MEIIMAIIDGTVSSDILTGTDGADEIYGYGGDDIIDGGDGNDRIDGGAGVDRMSGGTGDDWFTFSAISSANVRPEGVIDGGVGFDTLDLSNVSPVTVGTVSVTGGGYSLGVYVGGQIFAITGMERIILGSGANYFGGYGGLTHKLQIYAGEGNDDLTVDANIDAYGEGGDDRFFASGGDAQTGTIHGGDGRDTLALNISFDVDLAARTATSFGGSSLYRRSKSSKWFQAWYILQLFEAQMLEKRSGSTRLLRIKLAAFHSMGAGVMMSWRAGKAPTFWRAEKGQIF